MISKFGIFLLYIFLGYVVCYELYYGCYLLYRTTLKGVNELSGMNMKGVEYINLYREGIAYFYVEGRAKYNMYVLDKVLFMGSKELSEIPVYMKMGIGMGLKDMFYYGVAIYIFLNMVRGMKGDMGKNFDIKVESNVKMRLSDVVGNEEVKMEALEFVDMVKNGKRYIKMGVRMPRGVLLVGPTGTGKTLLCRAIAGECGVNFIHVSGSDFNEVFVGLGARRVKKIFTVARSMKPCIIFIDEIDALAKKRSEKAMSGEGSDDKENTLNALLVEMDGFRTDDGVLVIGATNRYDVLDSAILRAGRFDRKVFFGVPDRNDREKLFSYYLDKVRLSDEVDKDLVMSKVVDITYGFTGADVSNMCNEAGILAVRKNRKYIGEKHIMDALDYVLMGVERRGYYLSDIERRVISYHETGHAFLAHVLVDASRPLVISIVPRGRSALGYTMSESIEKKLRSRGEMIASIGVMCGGRIAEEVYMGMDKITTGASDDFRKAHDMAREMVESYVMFGDKVSMVIDDGGGYNRYGMDVRNRVDEIVNDLVYKIYKACRSIIYMYKDEVNDLSDKLLSMEKMVRFDIEDIYPMELMDSEKLNF